MKLAFALAVDSKYHNTTSIMHCVRSGGFRSMLDELQYQASSIGYRWKPTREDPCSLDYYMYRQYRLIEPTIVHTPLIH